MGTSIFLHHCFTTLPLLKYPFKITNTTNSLPFTYYYHHLNCKSSATGRTKINLEDELYTDPFDDDDDDGFGFSDTSAKKRVWWSDSDYDDDFDDDLGNEFWVFKVIRAFGWMVPAVGLSLLLGTGPNAFVMALAVPLGQTALSLVIDKVWGSASSRTKTRSQTRTRRKKPFVRSDNKEGKSKRKEENKTREENRSYKSWTAADGTSFKKDGKKVRKFGGWDELDDAHRVRENPSQKKDELPKQQNKGKLTRIRRMKDKPLFLRLLIAVFPFLSWSKFLF